MNRKLCTLFTALTVMVSTIGVSFAEDMPEMPQPTQEHAWLQQFVGEWESESEMYMDPAQPPVKSTGTETVRSLGGFWTVSEIQSTMMDKPFTGNMTLGYDPESQKYVGTWVDSMTGKLWNYEGTLDESGKVLTLESEGACPMRPGKITRFRDVVEVVDTDHRKFSSSMLDDNGQWVTMMVGHSRRK